MTDGIQTSCNNRSLAFTAFLVPDNSARAYAGTVVAMVAKTL